MTGCDGRAAAVDHLFWKRNVGDSVSVALSCLSFSICVEIEVE